jgi:hypothetical protein
MRTVLLCLTLALGGCVGYVGPSPGYYYPGYYSYPNYYAGGYVFGYYPVHRHRWHPRHHRYHRW